MSKSMHTASPEPSSEIPHRRSVDVGYNRQKKKGKRHMDVCSIKYYQTSPLMSLLIGIRAHQQKC